MKINSIKRHWQPDNNRRYNRDPFYQSKTWTSVKRAFKLGTTTLPDGRIMSNTMCIDCFKEGRVKAMYALDHITRIKDGGDRTDFSNLQGLCEHHHAVKSANEGNNPLK